MNEFEHYCGLNLNWTAREEEQSCLLYSGTTIKIRDVKRELSRRE